MTILIYLAFAWLVSTIVSCVVLLARYSPYSQKAIEHFSMGALILDCILWEFIFTVTGSLSLLNIYPYIRKKFLLSFFSFILMPIAALSIVLLSKQSTELFGAAEGAVIFLIVQVFFFFRFRKCMKRKTLLSVE